MDIYVPSLLIACGVAFFAGVHALLTGSSGFRRHANTAFGYLSLLLSVLLLLDAAISGTDSLTRAQMLMRIQITVSCLTYPAAFWFLSLYADMPYWRRGLMILAVLLGGLLIANQFGSTDVLHDQVVKLPDIITPWGERVHAYLGHSSSLLTVFLLAKGATYLWAAVCCAALWRRQIHDRAWPLTVYIVIQTLAAVHAQMLHFAGEAGVTYESLAFLPLLLLMGDRLRRDVQQQTRELAGKVADLRIETTRREHSEAELRHLAYHDRLTGLPNRLYLHKHLHTVMADADLPPSALIMFDIKHFRIINEALGHDAGDLLLGAFAERMRGVMSAGGLVSRQGSDDFAVHVDLPADTDPADAARAIVQSITATLVKPFCIGDNDLVIAVSAGIALIPQMARDADSALRQAAVALHRAKAGGDDHVVVFERVMQAESDRRLLLEKGLRVALERKEFELHYQPQVDRLGRFVGAEALLRWRHPEHGLISPAEFIPIAEEAGLIHVIGMEVLRQACLERETWPGEYGHARMSINVSPWQLFRHDFVAMVREVVRATQANPQRLTIEITESAFMHDLDDVVSKMHELGELGFEFSLDDFGSGYASLGNMKKLPLHELKIDRIFVEGLRPDARDLFINAIIAIAHDQHLHVVAEGVETDLQRDALIELDCDVLQGFLIARPLPAAELHRWLEGRRSSKRVPLV
ncbi:bifunctional diguanylate cyclase/phosphodiesterase [Rhodanobacter sp. AS-Z3]|uniref:putative bifunctional diguanylate cyclase/phosphodiesterase n=1 Tax=Rhodanobacter sp. AS-Z3 TaxID=3031330 RepID=UPI00247A4644|nr:bifunctional diguanylate cyclase/phosphodiesterase [Rhodanobacter sp. AS-Z3]WEN14013.1 bifunctional diguanylate cyclase/phosphodiesterase [Rhodanobacter sp. AS-Z3]